MTPLTEDQHVLEVEQEFSRCSNLRSELSQKLPSFGPRRFSEGLQQLLQALQRLFHEQLEVSRGLPGGIDTIATCKTFLYFISKLHENYFSYLETVPAAHLPTRLLLSIISHTAELTNKNDGEEYKNFVDIRFMPDWETNYGFFGLRDFPTKIDFLIQALPSIETKLEKTRNRIPKWFVFLHYPRIHARNLLFYPLLFHETAHFWDKTNSSRRRPDDGEITLQFSESLAQTLHPTQKDLSNLFEERIKQFRTENKRRPNAEEEETLLLDAYVSLNQLTSNWLREIVCDLVATHHCGPAYVMALLDFTTRVDAMRLDSDTHPGADLRLWFILRKLSNFRAGIYHRRLKQYLASNSRRIRKGQLKPSSDRPEYGTIYAIAYRIILRHAQKIIDRTLRELPIAGYKINIFNKQIPELVNNFKRGKAASDYWSRALDGPPNRPFSVPSILNAAWITYLYHMREFKDLFEPETPDGNIIENLTDVASQALEGAETLAYWRKFAPKKPSRFSEKAGTRAPGQSRSFSSNSQGILTKDTIIKLLRNGDLTVFPLLDPNDQIEIGSINLRLGTSIITTKRTERGTLTPANLSAEDIAYFQEKVSYTFGHRFVLHPLELVLASTFEFITLPGDVSAFVISRSRYGRLGLVAATATYVHPYWKGCLTLELVNFGTVPIELECGAAVAQLILLTAKPIKTPEPIRKIPVEPEFSVTKHPDWNVLKRFRDLHGLTESREESR